MSDPKIPKGWRRLRRGAFYRTGDQEWIPPVTIAGEWFSVDFSELIGRVKVGDVRGSGIVIRKAGRKS